VQLNPRRQNILKHIVEEYVVTAQPVGSEAVARRYLPTLSSATIRNEMAVLEGVGFIAQPHTSAGRVPTDSGYRYYVEQLMAGSEPTLGERRRIRHQFHQLRPEVGQWAHLASSVLADTVHAAAVVMLQQGDRQTFEQIYYEGLSHILRQPEFARSERLRPIVEVLERSRELSAFLADAMEDRDVQVIIGTEHRLEPLRSTATVLTRYGAGEQVRGVLGVVGPTRLPYWRAVPMVRFMAGVMDVLVESSYRAELGE